MLSGLSIETEQETACRALGDTRSLAHAHNLSAYDATHLELAMRGAMPLATLDEQLKKDAKSVGVAAFA